MPKTDPGRRIARISGRIQVRWSDERTQRVQRRVLLRRRRAAALRVMGAALSVLALLLCAPRLWRRLGPTPSERLAEGTLLLPDRSVVSPLLPGSVVQLREDTAHRTVVEVVRGRARFDVAHRPERVFRVEAGGVAVEVLGTAFTVDRGAEQVGVAVERGRVRVLWAGGRVELSAGQKQRFPVPAPPVPAQASPPLPAPAQPLAAPPLPHALPSAVPPPRMEVRPRPRRSPAERLLMEADAARQDRHPEAALLPLQRLLREYRADPRAPLAAFTLGKLQLEELGQPAEAARSFALVQALDPGGLLAQDALAREVEAWYRAGNESRARERAEEYVQLYPNGSRLPWVRRYGHLP